MVNQGKALEERALILEENIRLREEVEHITRHDLKAPLTAIIGFPEVLMGNKNLTPRQRDLIQKIQKTGYRMLEQINCSLDLYRIEQDLYELKSEPILLEILLHRIKAELESLSSNLGINIVIKCEKNTSVMGEALILFSMFSNLIKNALEAAPKNSSVTVSARVESEHIIEIHNMGAVPVQIRDRFFDKLSTAGKAGGTGLGTYSARLFARTHEGDVEMTTSEESGTLVTIHLPLSPTNVDT
jgi:signal transduction histidine kinase